MTNYHMKERQELLLKLMSGDLSYPHYIEEVNKIRAEEGHEPIEPMGKTHLALAQAETALTESKTLLDRVWERTDDERLLSDIDFQRKKTVGALGAIKAVK